MLVDAAYERFYEVMKLASRTSGRAASGRWSSSTVS
jgi:hypothetical protein